MIPILTSLPSLNSDIKKELSALGIGIELTYFSTPEHLDDAHVERAVPLFRTLLRDFPHLVTMHGAFYDLNITARDSKIRHVCKERIVQSLVIANELNIQHVVFHTNFQPAITTAPDDYKRYWVEAQVKFWQQIAPIAQDLGVTCLLENTREPDASYIAAIADALDCEAIQICFDTGHSRCFTHTAHPLEDWALGFGKHLSHIHLHTNRGKKDDHLAFNHTEGVLQFDNFFTYICNLPTPPRVVIEVKTKADFEQSVEGLRALSIL